MTPVGPDQLERELFGYRAIEIKARRKGYFGCLHARCPECGRRGYHLARCSRGNADSPDRSRAIGSGSELELALRWQYVIELLLIGGRMA